MPIVLAPKNKELQIIRVTANGSITVLSSDGGSVVCRIKDGRIALDSGLSARIFVR